MRGARASPLQPGAGGALGGKPEGLGRKHSQAETAQSPKVRGIAAEDLSVAPDDCAGCDEEVDVGHRQAFLLKRVTHPRRQSGGLAVEGQDAETISEAANPSQLP